MIRSQTALITGVTGQDGWYLSQHLLSEGYTVIGTSRRPFHASNTSFPVIQIELENRTEVERLIRDVRPDECYHLSARHHSSLSRNSMGTGSHTFAEDYQAFHESNCQSTLNLLSALLNACPDSRFFFAGSAHMFGTPQVSPQTEETPWQPDTHYSITKCAAASLSRMVRSKFGFFASTGILYNHESPRRAEDFVSRRIAKAVAQIKRERQFILTLGNLDSVVDWGFAGDYVRAMTLILRIEEPGDYIISTGIPHTIRDFVQIAFNHVDLNWEKYVNVDPSLVRVSSKTPFVGDNSKLKKDTAWEPQVSFEELVKTMVDHEMELCL